MKIKVRIFDLPNYCGNYEDCILTTEYDMNGEISGYWFNRKGSNLKSWYGSNIFNYDIKNGLLLELENITPEKKVHGFNFTKQTHT